MLVLWGERSAVHKRFDPLALWCAPCAAQVSAEPMAVGHFIPEERPAEFAAHLLRHFA